MFHKTVRRANLCWGALSVILCSSFVFVLILIVETRKSGVEFYHGLVKTETN